MSAFVVGILWGAGAAIAVWLGRRIVWERRVRRRARQQVGLLSEDSRWVIGQLLRDAEFAMGSRHRNWREALPWRRRALRRRHEAITRDLGPTLMLVIGQLRVGHGVIAALNEVAASTPAPLGEILTEAVSAARLGTPLEEVFEELAATENEPHLGILASALGLHARHGGSIVEIMQVLVETIEEEDALRRDIRSLTADGRLSARVLLAMPVASVSAISLMSPGYMLPLINEPLGRALAVTGLILGVIGWRWLAHLASPQVTL